MYLPSQFYRMILGVAEERKKFPPLSKIHTSNLLVLLVCLLVLLV
jgi:hypothetical protein